MIELAEEQPTQQHTDIITGVGELIERLRERSGVQPRGSMYDVYLADLLAEAAQKLEAVADELIDAQTKLALALSREQELIDELIPLKGERALLNAGKEYKRYELGERKDGLTYVEPTMSVEEVKALYFIAKSTFQLILNESITYTNGYSTEVYLDNVTNHKYEFEFANSDYPWFVRSVKFEG